MAHIIWVRCDIFWPYIQQQSLILRVLAAILHLGNVVLEDSGSDSTKIDVNQKPLSHVCDLLGVEQTQLAQWLGHRRIQTVGEKILWVVRKHFKRICKREMHFHFLKKYAKKLFKEVHRLECTLEGKFVRHVQNESKFS